MNLQRFAQSVFSSILARLNGQHFYPPSDKPSQIIGVDIDASSSLGEPEIDVAANSLLLQIREHGHERFSPLPMYEDPVSPYHCEILMDRRTGFNIRALSFQVVDLNKPFVRLEVLRLEVGCNP